jgi:hypothetical protein
MPIIYLFKRKQRQFLNTKNLYLTICFILFCQLAQRQLFILSKRINMQELVGEFEEKVCEIIADTIFNSIKRHQMYYSQNKQNPVIQVKNIKQRLKHKF